VNQTPRRSQPGQPGKTVQLQVELHLIADIGFVGLPNAGKSTLLKTLTNADPKIGNYAFTTKIPNLGVMDIGYEHIVLADIPGLIKGASQGAGLGTRFLKHIARTAALVFLVDLSSDDYEQHFDILSKELSSFRKELMEKKCLIVGTKLDLDESKQRLDVLLKAYPDKQVIGVSSYTGEGIQEVKKIMAKLAG
jgi:GTP-binding protein